MDERKERRAKFYTNGNYLFAGLMKCGLCGGSVCGGVRYNHRNHRTPTPYYHCNRRDRSCPTTSTNAEYLETYVYRLLTWCLFKKENSQKLIDLVKMGYIKTYENMQAEYNRLLAEIEEKETFIKENLIKEAQEDKKSLRKYLMDETYQARWEVNDITRKAQLLNERISMYPAFKPKRVIKMAESYLQRLKSTNDKELQETYREIIHLITMDNEKICVTFNLQKLLGAYEPIHATVIEVRNHIGQPRQHDKQVFEFAELSVRV